MMQGIREFFNSKAGKGSAVVLIVVAIGFVGYSLKSNLGQSDAAAASRGRTYVCSETGKSFQYELSEGAREPVPSPFSGKNTGYPAVFCYWTKEGTMKSTPTAVLLNSYLGKKGPTFCPDCGRLVLPNNPSPIPGDKAPPTEQEYKAHPQTEAQ